MRGDLAPRGEGEGAVLSGGPGSPVAGPSTAVQSEIAIAVGLSKTSVSDYLARAERVGLDWQQAEDLPEREVEERLFRQLDRNEPAKRAPIDLDWVHREMRRTGVTFCDAYGRYRRALAHDAPSASSSTKPRIVQQHFQVSCHTPGVEPSGPPHTTR